MHARSQSPAASRSASFALARTRSAVLSFHVPLQRAFARWRIMQPFADSHAREITAGHVDRAAAMWQSGERQSINSVGLLVKSTVLVSVVAGCALGRRGKAWQVCRDQVNNSREAEWRPAANWAKRPSWVALDRRHERSAARLPYIPYPRSIPGDTNSPRLFAVFVGAPGFRRTSCPRARRRHSRKTQLSAAERRVPGQCRSGRSVGPLKPHEGASRAGASRIQ